MAKKKKISLLSKKQEKQLRKMATDLIDVASHVVNEYEDLELADFGLNDISSSLNDIIQIHGDSPFLEEIFDGDSWKTIIKNMPELPGIDELNKFKKDKKDDTK
jgi:hypothetical protein